MENTENKKYIITPEKRKEYNKKFYESHQESTICESCGGHYKYYYKSKHLNTRIHKLSEKINKII